MPKEQFRSNLRSSRHGGPLNALNWVTEQLLVRPVVTIGLMKRSFQQAFASPLGVWTGTGIVVAAAATVFFNGSAVLRAVHSPLVTSEHKVWAQCVLRVWDASEQLNINAECGRRPRRWVWEASQN
tara:strand:- start:1042 stop:1419 length:378 start_codon:yes stop_codon:yes gene_type:complete